MWKIPDRNPRNLKRVNDPEKVPATGRGATSYQYYVLVVGGFNPV